MREQVFIIDEKYGQAVSGMLVSPVNDKHLKDVVDLWEPWINDVREEMQRPQTNQPWVEHVLWNWGEKIASVKELLTHKTFAVECKGVTQGLIRLRVDPTRDICRISEQQSLPLVYIEYISVAPWNLPKIIVASQFSGVGMALFIQAIRVSIEEGFKGRIGLHAIPQSVSWYENKCGMTNWG